MDYRKFKMLDFIITYLQIFASGPNSKKLGMYPLYLFYVDMEVKLSNTKDIKWNDVKSDLSANWIYCLHIHSQLSSNLEM